MKLRTILAVACTTIVLAKPDKVNPRASLTIEVAPGVTRQITEDERYELSAVGKPPHSLVVADRNRAAVAEATFSISRTSMPRFVRSRSSLRIQRSSSTRRTSGVLFLSSLGITSRRISSSILHTTHALVRRRRVLRLPSGCLLRLRMSCRSRERMV
jgi:hypothetical protein